MIKHKSLMHRKRLPAFLPALLVGLAASLTGCDNDDTDSETLTHVNIETPTAFAEVQLTDADGVIASGKTDAQGIAELVMPAQRLAGANDADGMLVTFTVDAGEDGRYRCLASECGSYNGTAIRAGDSLPKDATQGLRLLNYRLLKRADNNDAATDNEFDAIQITYLGSLAGAAMQHGLGADVLTAENYSTHANNASRIVMAALNLPSSALTNLQTWNPTTTAQTQPHAALMAMTNQQMSRSYAGPSVTTSGHQPISAVVFTEQLAKLSQAQRQTFEAASISIIRRLAMNHQAQFATMQLTDNSQTASQMALLRQQKGVDMERLLQSLLPTTSAH